MKIKQTKLTKKDAFDIGIGGLFTGFSGMMYESEEQWKDRSVATYDENDIVVDTCYTSDTGYFETAILHTRYYDDLIIVDEYNSRKEAEKGHKMWIKVLTSKTLPEIIKDVHLNRNYKLK